jgi:hypothetical protein
MSLVNSFINQIGRELGRDAYKTVMSSSSRNRRQQQIVESEEPLYNQIIDFELLANDEKTYRHLANLVEKAEHTDPEDFEWQELFLELDNKIDFCKSNLSEEYQTQLEKLDELNAENFKRIKEKHLRYINTIVSYYSNVELSKKNTLIASLLTLIGLRASYLGEKMIYTVLNLLYLVLLALIFVCGYLTYKNPIMYGGNLPNKTAIDIETIQSTGIVLMDLSLFLYLIYLGRGAYKIFKYRKEIKKNSESRIKFETYKIQLLN